LVRHLATFLALSNTVIMKQLTDTENDMAVAALFCASLAYGVRSLQRPQWANSILCAASLGVLVGIKYYALPYAALACASITLAMLGCHGLGPTMRNLAAAGLGMLLLGGYWYIRNTTMTGSPLHPMGFTPATDLLHRAYPEVWRSSFWSNPPREVALLGMQASARIGGPC